MARKTRGQDQEAIGSIKYRAQRRNIPPAGIASHGELREEAPYQFAFNPHLPPQLRSSPDAADLDRLPELVATARQRALTDDEAETLAAALKRHEPWLEWSGKRERPWFEVDPVALHMHERVSTQAILRVMARDDPQRDLFADPQLDYAKAVQFYQHDVDWANRMILGDSLQVMASLARREDLAGKVQMIYIDPPYGISFRSNFQPNLANTQPEDKQRDISREPEMIQAYRDTWTLGVHSYVSYLRDRLSIAREMLSETGSIFVQISDENIHLVRCLLDETFGRSNFISMLTFTKKGSQSGDFVRPINEFVLWYAFKRSRALERFRPLYFERAEIASQDFRYFERSNGESVTSAQLAPGETDVRRFSSNALFSQKRGPNETVELRGTPFQSGGNSWKVSPTRVPVLEKAERLLYSRNRVRYKRFADDFPAVELTNVWSDLAGTTDKVYVVQTNPKVIERCMLMTTDPGDLVLDPTCGSGTTAYVAEQWGRRWITVDTSRVALTLAKHRLMTARFDYYRLRELNSDDLRRNPDGSWISEVNADGTPTGTPMTFQCRALPHIMLSDIARNSSLDPIFEHHEPIVGKALKRLNERLTDVKAATRGALVEKLVRKHREEGANAVTDADVRRWLLPGTPPDLVEPERARRPLKALTTRQAEGYRERIPKTKWREWEVPFDTDPDWPPSLRSALNDYRSAWRAKMEDVNECIAANATTEELVDKPEVVPGTVRVAGAFTMEGVIGLEEGPDSPIGGASEDLELYDADVDGDLAAANAEAHLDKMIRLLKASGVDFAGNRRVQFAYIHPVHGPSLIHAEGEWDNGSAESRRVAVSIGPEVGNMTSVQVEDAIRHANRAGYDDVVFASFGFDAAAQEAVEGASHRNLRLHMALIHPDVAMDDLLKTQPGSQLFTVFSAPRVTGPVAQNEGEYTVSVEGMDVYDPVAGTLHPTDRQRIAAWFVDTDYDGRTFCICQAFFPDRSKWDRLARALDDIGLVERGAFDALSGWTSLPFSRPSRRREGEGWRVAVKVIDPRGNEGLRVLAVDADA
ncbi:MAG: site-specific DNA-methyltransferase [Gammaproteobacteria bacterium]|nr:site-specific DNA-methyltransferase [Gammaproteobacteria bacterium]